MSPSGHKRVSRNCANCRAVKRRCDKNRPHCGQCVRLHQECSGYRDEWELIFRDQTSRTVQRVRGKPVSRDNHGTQPAGVDVHCSRKIKSNNTYVKSMNKPQSFSPSRLSDLPPTIALGSMIGNQLLASYLNDYFPGQFSPTCPLDMSHAILSGIFMLPQKTLTLEKASSALSCVFLGKLHRDKPLLQYGLSLYIQAIRGMSKALGQKAYSDDIVYTCMLFGQIETHHCQVSLSEWYAHTDGLSAIMQFNCPKETSSPIINAIFGQHQKFKVLLSRLMYLSDPIIEWLREPGEGLLHEIIQILTDLSCLAAAVDNADLLNRQACKSLLDDCLALEKRHMDFYIVINGADSDPSTYACGEFKSGIPSTGDLFGPAYKFRSVGEANLYICFWTSLSYFYPLIRRVQLAMTDAPEFLGTDCHSPQSAVHHLAAFYISKAIRCLPYCTQEGMNAWPMYYGIFAVTQAARIFSHVGDWERFGWTQDAMHYCGLLGFDRAARVRDIWCNYYFDTSRHNFYRLPSYEELTMMR